MKHQPLFLQLIRAVSKGCAMLDEAVQQEIIEFIVANQHANGAFTDRGGAPDHYYSVFGALLVKALQLHQCEIKLQPYLNHSIHRFVNSIDTYSLIFLRLLFLNEKELPELKIRDLLKDRQTNFTYKIFLYLLVADSQGKMNIFFRFMLKIGLKCYRLPHHSPLSYYAAIMVLRHKAGLKTLKLQNEITAFVQQDGAFGAYRNIDKSDLLSTAVAVFALHLTAFDLRAMKPTLMNFIQNCYNSVAFVSGTGDNEKDLEYTFYGLLALGSLSEKVN